MMMAAMLIHTLHAALKDREEALDGIGVDITVGTGNILTVHVLDDTVTGEILAQVKILIRFVGHYLGLGRNIFSQDRDKGHGLKVVYNHAARASGVTVHKGQHLVFVFVTAPLLRALGLLGAIIADKGFVHFNGAATFTEHLQPVRLHGLADTVTHEPSSFEGHAKGTMQLVGANALLAGRNQEDGLQPKAQRDMAGLEDGPYLDGKGLTAVIALVGSYTGALATHLADALKTAAVWADRAVRPYASLYEFVGRFFVVELGFRKNGHDCSPIR